MKSNNSKHFFNQLFKAVLMLLIASSISIITPAVHANDQENAISQEESEAKLDKLKASIKKMTSWLFQANDEKADLNKELKRNELKINQLSKQIRTSNMLIESNNAELTKLKSQAKEFKQTLKTQQHFLEKQIQVAYFQEDHSKIKLLLNTDNPQDIARQMHYFDYIKEARKEKIDQISTLVSSLQETEIKIKQKTETLKQDAAQLESRQLELKQSIKTKQKLLTKLEQGIKNNSQRLNKMQADQARLKSLLEKLEASLVNMALPSDSAPFSQQKFKLPWPSHGKVVAEYGSSVAEGKLALNGIRFATKDNQEVQSVYSGRVIFANWIRGFGLLIIVDHGDQFMSLYGNNKSLTKETGDWVRAGEIIAISSESTSSQESGLYFEIRKQGKPLNPRQWLRK